MKKILIALACATTVGAFAQGTFVAENRNLGAGVNAPVTLNGTLASGTQLSAQFYAGPAGSTDAQLLPVGLVYTFKTTQPGYLAAVGDPTSNANDSTIVPGVAGGGNAVVELRAWTGGTTFATATSKGQSAQVTVALGGAGSPPSLPSDPIGLAGFNVTATVPEPATIALAGIGAAALLFRRRKQA